MNELQETQFNLLKCFSDVCKKLELKYFLVCGSALGAVKYGGFIPWDDDIDVGLPRKDYEIFCEKAQELLPEWVFLQNYRTDPVFPQIFTKLRDSRTTYIEKTVAHLPINHGVGIDIFPLDGYPVREKDTKIIEFKKRLYQSLLLSTCDIPRSSKNVLLCRAYKLFGLNRNVQAIAEKYDNLIRQYDYEGSSTIANHGNWQGVLEYAPAEQYGNGAFMKFEGIDVYVPEKYDEYLTQKYGNWRDDPPLSEQIGHHYYEVCDLNNPYTVYK